MKSMDLKGKIGGAILAFSIIFGIGIISSLTAQAQWRGDRDRSERRDRDREWRRDRERNRDRDNGDWNRDDSYRRDDRYRRNGDYGTYRGRNGGYGGNGGYNNIYRMAQQRGYQDGVYTGSNDAQRGQSYNPQRSRYYKNATDGYNSSYGNKDAYKQAYRNGFLQGYEQGFRQYDGYNNNRRSYPQQRNRAGDILGTIFGRP